MKGNKRRILELSIVVVGAIIFFIFTGEEPKGTDIDSFFREVAAVSDMEDECEEIIETARSMTPMELYELADSYPYDDPIGRLTMYYATLMGSRDATLRVGIGHLTTNPSLGEKLIETLLHEDDNVAHLAKTYLDLYRNRDSSAGSGMLPDCPPGPDIPPPPK